MRKQPCIRQTGVVNGIDFDAHYKVKGYSGVAFYLLGWYASPKYFEDLGDEVCLDEDDLLEASDSQVIAVMVGDDRRHVVDIKDLTKISEESYCHICGQIGCGCTNI